MKPGICVLCGKPCVDEVAPNTGDYIKFSDYQEPAEFSLDDATGMEYFCDEHVNAAKDLSSFTSKDALAALKDQFGIIIKYKPPRKIGLLKRVFSIMKRS